MTDYQYKYQKYKNKIKQLTQRNSDIIIQEDISENTNIKNGIRINSLLVYPQRAMINIDNVSKEKELLPGYIEDSIKLVDGKGTPKDFTISANNTLSQKIYQNANVIVITENGDRVNGTIESLEPKIVTIIINGDIHVISRWKQIIIAEGKHNKPMILTNSDGNLQYMVNTIGWYPIYDLYLDSDDLEKPNSGKLYLSALISNRTNNNITIDRTILVAGNIVIEEAAQRPAMYSAQAVRAAPVEHAPIEEIPFSELLTFPIEKRITINGEKYSLPLYDYKVEAQKIYQFDISRYNEPNEKYIEANHGYILTVTDRELPMGLMKIYAKSSSLKTTLLFGSVRINRTPKGEPIEVIIGKTPRIRALFNKSSSNTNFEKGIVNKTKYNISDIKISGEIVNETDKKQKVTLKDWIGNATIITVEPKPKRLNDYLEWNYEIGPGNTSISISYQIRY